MIKKLGNPVDLRNVGMGFSTPKTVYRNPPLSVRTVSANRNNLEEGVAVEEFDQKLFIDKNSPNTNRTQNNQSVIDYSILSSRTKLTRIINSRPDPNNLAINRGNNLNSNNENKKCKIKKIF